MNFSMDERHIANVERIVPLIEKLEAMVEPTANGADAARDAVGS